MIEILVGTEALDISRSSSISIEERLPLFDENKLPAEFTYPIDFPTTDKNKRLLKYAHLLDEQLDKYEVLIVLRVNTINTTGILAYSIKSTGFQGNIKIGSSAILKSLETISLFNVNYGPPTFFGNNITEKAQHMKNSTLYPDDYNYVFFPVFFPNLYNGLTDNIIARGHNKIKIVNAYWFDEGFEVFYNVDSVNIALPDQEPVDKEYPSVIPFFYTRFVIKKMLLHFGYDFIDTFFIGELKYHCLFNTSTLFKHIDYTPGLGITQDSWQDFIFAESHVPKISCLDFLNGVSGNLGVQFIFVESEKKVYTKSYNTSVASVDDIITIDEFVDPNTIEKDLTTTGYTIEDDIDSADASYNEQPYTKKIVIGNGEKEFKTKSGVPNESLVTEQVFTILQGFADIILWQGTPITYQIGNTAIPGMLEGLSDNPFSLRFMIYRGYLPAGQHSIPVGNVSNIFQGNTFNVINLKLEERPTTLYKSFTFYSQALRKIGAIAYLPYTVLLKLKAGAKVLIQNTKLTPTKLNYDLPAKNGIIKTRIETYRL